VEHCNPTPKSGPAGIGTGISVWLKADAGTNSNADGSATGDWQDQSGNGNHYLEVVGPKLQTDALNFNPTVEILSGGFNAPNGAALTPQNTVIAVAKKLGTDINGRLFDGATGNYLWGYHDVARNSIYINGIPGEYTTGIAIDAGTLDPHIFAYLHNGTAGLEARADGASLKTFGSSRSAAGIRVDINQGRFSASSQSSDSQVSEFVLYDRVLSSTERQQVESYLALKYGMTLDQTAPQDYLASDSAIAVWDSSAPGASSFNHDIFGIGRDDVGQFGQIKSSSINNDSILTITAEGEGTNNQNTSFVDIDDLEFLTIGNDDGAETWTNTGAPSGSQILSRQWRVQETGEVGSVTLDFDVSHTDFDIPALLSGAIYNLVLDTDNDGNLSDETLLAMTNPSGNIWQATGVDLEDGQAFTIATADSFAVTVNQASAQPDPTAVSPILFEVVFAEAIDPASFVSTDVNSSSSSASGVTVNSITEIAPNDGTTFQVSMNATGTGSVIISLDAGVVNSTASGTNLASTSTDKTVIFDNQSPQAFSVGAEITGSYDVDTPRISFSTTDDTAIDRYEVDIDGAGFSVQTSPYEPTLAALPSHTVTVRAYDDAGNFTESIVAYPPSVVITAPTTILNVDITDTTFVVDGPVAMGNIDSITVTGPLSTTFTCGGDELLMKSVM